MTDTISWHRSNQSIFNITFYLMNYFLQIFKIFHTLVWVPARALHLTFGGLFRFLKEYGFFQYFQFVPCFDCTSTDDTICCDIPQLVPCNSVCYWCQNTTNCTMIAWLVKKRMVVTNTIVFLSCGIDSSQNSVIEWTTGWGSGCVYRWPRSWSLVEFI